MKKETLNRVAVVLVLALIIYLVYDGYRGKNAEPKRARIIDLLVVQISNNLSVMRDSIRPLDYEGYERELPESVDIVFKDVKDLPKVMKMRFKFSKECMYEIKEYRRKLLSEGVSAKWVEENYVVTIPQDQMQYKINLLQETIYFFKKARFNESNFDFDPYR